MRSDPQKEWTFVPRFRRNPFGWRSQPAIARVKEAVAEIRKVARTDPRLAAEGAVLFLTKVSAALEQIDSSSGAMGRAVERAIGALVPIIAGATVNEAIRERWLDSLWRALEADEIPYIESIGESWGELCGSEAVASVWADRLLDDARYALDPYAGEYRYYFGTTPCLSALFYAGRYSELVQLLEDEKYWPYRRWAADALVASGRRSDALRAAESCRCLPGHQSLIDRYCEELLLASGMRDEAYRRYGLMPNRSGTRLAWFRALVKNYPDRSEAEILEDLVALTPKDEGTWFAAAKSAGLYERALELARTSPNDPRTLTRAARDFQDRNTEFALEAGLTAIHWMVRGVGFEVKTTDMTSAYSSTLNAAERLGRVPESLGRIRKTLEGFGSNKKLVVGVLKSLLEAESRG